MQTELTGTYAVALDAAAVEAFEASSTSTSTSNIASAWASWVTHVSTDHKSVCDLCIHMRHDQLNTALLHVDSECNCANYKPRVLVNVLHLAELILREARVSELLASFSQLMPVLCQGGF